MSCQDSLRVSGHLHLPAHPHCSPCPSWGCRPSPAPALANGTGPVTSLIILITPVDSRPNLVFVLKPVLSFADVSIVFIISVSEVTTPLFSASPFAASNNGLCVFAVLARRGSFVSTHLPCPDVVQASSPTCRTRWAGAGRTVPYVSGDSGSNPGLAPVFVCDLVPHADLFVLWK